MPHAMLRLIMLVGLFGCAGCAAKHADVCHASRAPRYTIFNPHFTPQRSYTMHRSSWPSADAVEYPFEDVEYEITTYDRQGTYGGERDHLIRRFRSVRSGRSWR